MAAPHTPERIDYRELLGAVRAIVWRADATTFQTTFASSEAEEILGYPVDQWLTVPGFWVSRIHPDDRDAVIALTSAAVREGRQHDFEYRLLTADGRVLWLRNIVRVKCRDGQPIELIGVTVDVSDRKRAEFESAQLRHELMRLTGAAALGEVAGALAHELNQPLGAIVSGAESAQLLLAAGPSAHGQLAEVVGDVREQAVRAGDIMSTLLTMLRHQPLRIVPVAVQPIVDSVVTLVRPLAASRGIDLAVDVPADLPLVLGATVQLQQLLLNLMVNAIEAIATTDGGHRHVAITAAADARGGIEVRVADSGGGIAADVMPRLFEPFVTTKPDGNGIGLSVCRRIVDAHGGHITAANNDSGGATFRFTLPSAESS